MSQIKRYSISIFTLVLAVLFCTSLEAQEGGRRNNRRGSQRSGDENATMVERPSTPRFVLSGEGGINATTLFDKIFREGVDSANLNPYLLTGRVSYRQWGLRGGIGGSYRKTLASQAGFRDYEENESISFDARLGLDYRRRLGRRFSTSVGIDAVWSYNVNDQVIDSGFDVIERIDQFKGFGFGPSINLAWWFNKRVGLMTEANFYWMSGRRQAARNFKNFPELNDNIVNNDVDELRIYMPSSIFLIYMF